MQLWLSPLPLLIGSRPGKERLSNQLSESYKRWESSSFQPAEGAKEGKSEELKGYILATRSVVALLEEITSLGGVQRCLVLITAVFLRDHCEMLAGELLAGNHIGSCLLKEDQLMLVAA